MSEKNLAPALLAYLANTVGESVLYPWTLEQRLNNIHEGFQRIHREIERAEIDFTKMAVPELLEWGFRRYSEDSPLMLIPIWLWPSIPDGTQLHSISGNTKIKGVDEPDLDNRAGMLAWGILAFVE